VGGRPLNEALAPEVLVLLRRLAILATLLPLSACVDHATMRERYWKAEISNNLKVGASAPEVLKFFDSRGAETHEHPSSIMAIERNVDPSGGVITTDIVVVCALDQRRKLARCETKKWYTGP
jgi:hypothetical protein